MLIWKRYALFVMWQFERQIMWVSNVNVLFIKTESTIKNKKPVTKNQIFSKVGKQIPFPYHKCCICGLPNTASDWESYYEHYCIWWSTSETHSYFISAFISRYNLLHNSHHQHYQMYKHDATKSSDTHECSVTTYM